jgi:predicted Zn-dependent protease
MSAVLQILEEALRADGGEVELSYLGTRQGATRFAGSRITQSGDVMDHEVQARVAVGRRIGAARTNRVDRDSLQRTINQARALAAAQPEPAPSEPFAGFDDGRAQTPEVAPSFDAATAAAGAEARAALVAPAFAATARAGLTAAGLAATSETELAVATHAGCRRTVRTTSARLDVIGTDGTAAARTSRYATSLDAVAAQAQALAETACERALGQRAPVELAPGPYDVILEPAAVAELLEWLALTGLSARTVEDGSSCLAGRAGQRLTGPVTIYDDALGGEDGCPTLPFDSEGTPKRRVVFLDGGVADGPAYDRATAARAGTGSTGHAAPLGDDLFEGGPVPQHLHLGAGPDSVAALLGRIERGLYVARFHYVNGLIDTRRALMTGMTRDGLFLVENGRIGRGVANLRWTESLLEAFARIDGVGQVRQIVAGSLSGSVYVCPAVLVRGWRFTGTSR